MATQRQNIFRRMTSVVKSAKPWLCFTAESANIAIRLDKVVSPDAVTLETSPDGKTWTAYTWSGNTGATITLTSVGDKCYWRASADNTKICDSTNFYKFRTSGNISVSGSLASLMKKSGNVDFPDYNFSYLFSQCSITTAPDISGASAGTRTFMEAFASSLIEAFVIPDMPIIGDTSFIRVCKGCTSLRSAKIEIKDVNRSTFLYQAFQGCSSLNNVEVKFTSWPSDSSAALGNWLDGVAETGTFYCPDELPDPDPSERGASTVPSGWTIVRPHQRYVAQENLVLHLDCKVGVEQDGRLGKWTTVDGQYTFNAGLYTIDRDSKGGLLLDGNGFTLSEVLPWLIEDGYSVEVCARQSIDKNDPTIMRALFSVCSGGTEETRENICAIAELFNKQAEDSNISSIATGGFFSADRVVKTFQQTLNGELFTAYFHPSDNTCKLNGMDGVTIPFTEELPYESQARTFVVGTGILYSVRVYNRALTASEQLHNRQLDIERFGIN